ncbi:MAG: hypothetical protein Q8R47_00355 [Nanoarchaeota archaeon]|nr:hypothetical protein [Nanoarchaeota archaeon]
MAWEAKSLQHLLEFTYLYDNGRPFVHSQEYTRDEEGFAKLSISISPEDREVRVKPYTLERLQQAVEEEYQDSVVNDLLVGIRDGEKITYVAKFWTSKKFKDKRVEQYFFKYDQPSSFNLGFMSGPGWPLNHPPMLDERLLQYFNVLKEIRPNVIGSLDLCLEHLARPGPNYTGRSDGSISFSLK